MPRVKTIGARLGTVAPRLRSVAADSWRVSGMTSAQRGYGYKWQKARAAYLLKHPFCAFCLRDVGIEYHQDAEAIGLECEARGVDLPFGNVVDHIEAHRGDQKLFWDFSNVQTLCATHHSSEKQKEEAYGLK